MEYHNMALKYLYLFIALSGFVIYDSTASPANTRNTTPKFREFDLKLYEGLRTRQPGTANLVFSPASIRTVLAMLREGAAGQTRRDLEKSLGDTSRPTSLLFPRSQDEGFEIANALFLSSQFVVSRNYHTSVASRFGAWVEYSDFSRPRSAAQKINEWVSRATKGHITQLVSRDSLSAATMLLIANAVHLHGKWSHPFPEGNTKYATFFEGFCATNSSTIEVPTMSQYNYFRIGYVASLDAKVIELPFEEPAGLSMLILLPKQRDGLLKMLESLEPQSLSDILDSMGEPSLVHVSLPRFTAHTTQQLNSILPQELHDVFTDNADFSRMTQNDDKVRVSQALHKATLSVDEKGAVGSAVSAVTAILLHSGSPLEFNASHPFAYMIVDNRDADAGNVEPVFMGYVTSIEPEEQENNHPEIALSVGEDAEQTQTTTTPASPTRIFFNNNNRNNSPSTRRTVDAVRYPTSVPSTQRAQ